MLSFHFPQKGSSAAQSVPANKHAVASEKYKRFMVTLRRRIIVQGLANTSGKVPSESAVKMAAPMDLAFAVPERVTLLLLALP
jgi:hypothetical protein